MSELELKQIKILLEEIQQVGAQQLEDFKMQYEALTSAEVSTLDVLSGKISAIDLVADPLVFLMQHVDQYWQLYTKILDSIENPLIQFTLRTLMELSYSKIICFSQLEDDKQAQIAIKYWMCTLALLVSAENSKITHFSLKDYDHLAHKLTDEKDILKFRDFKSKGFPFDSVQSTLHGLLPSISQMKNKQIDLLNTFMGEDDQTRNLLNKQYRYLSMLPHGNLVVLTMLSKERDHLLRSVKMLQVTSSVIIKYLHNEAEFKVDIDSFLEIEDKILRLLKKGFNLKCSGNQV